MNLESLHTTKATAIIQINLLLDFIKYCSFLDAVKKLKMIISKPNFSLWTTFVKDYFLYLGSKLKPV
jgi:hypothetical protein